MISQFSLPSGNQNTDINKVTSTNAPMKQDSITFKATLFLVGGKYIKRIMSGFILRDLFFSEAGA